MFAPRQKPMFRFQAVLTIASMVGMQGAYGIPFNSSVVMSSAAAAERGI